MRRYRISVTMIENFRRFMVAGPENTFDTEEALMDKLTSQFKGNDKTVIGGAFHAIAEKPTAHERIRWQGDDYVAVGGIVPGRYVALPESVAVYAERYHRQHPAMFHEIPVGKMYTFEAEGFEIYLSGKCDGMEGAEVRDLKLKFRSVHSDRDYMDSVQWKSYLALTSARRFWYDVFVVRGYKEWPGWTNVQVEPEVWKNIAFIAGIELEQHDAIPCISYPTITDDVRDLLRKFMQWIDLRNVACYLTKCNERGFKTI